MASETKEILLIRQNAKAAINVLRLQDVLRQSVVSQAALDSTSKNQEGEEDEAQKDKDCKLNLLGVVKRLVQSLTI